MLKLKDIADKELGKDSYAYKGTMDGHPGISCMVFQTAGSNATEVNRQIDRLLEEARKDLPKGVEPAVWNTMQEIPGCPSMVP